MIAPIIVFVYYKRYIDDIFVRFDLPTIYKYLVII